jgi:anti-sigma B factor antagonist
MDIEIQYLKRSVLVTASGRIVTANVPEFEEAFTGLVEEGHYNIVAELSGIEYMISRGLRAMIAAYRDCKEKGGDIRIANPSKRMRDVLEIGTADTLFTIYDDAVSAVGSF